MREIPGKAEMKLKPVSKKAYSEESKAENFWQWDQDHVHKNDMRWVPVKNAVFWSPLQTHPMKSSGKKSKRGIFSMYTKES